MLCALTVIHAVEVYLVQNQEFGKLFHTYRFLEWEESKGAGTWKEYLAIAE